MFGGSMVHEIWIFLAVIAAFVQIFLARKKAAHYIAMILPLCFLAFGTVSLASEGEGSVYSYREELLVSYKEYWYVDGAGIESHVRYGEQYKVFTFLNGYRELSPTITPLPLDDGSLPQNVPILIHQEVKLKYEFY